MEDKQLLRYSRHVLLPEFGIEGQQSLRNAHALIIGAGGLGSPAALFLASSGIGKLTLCDPDRVDLTNLQRQLLHDNESVDHLKVDSARIRLQRVNPSVEVTTLAEHISADSLPPLVSQADVILDCSDNFETRYALNRVAFALKKPLVSGAAIRFEGQISVFDSRQSSSPCYECLYPESGEADELRCAVMGVFSPLVGVIGSLQASEAIKIITGIGSPLVGKLVLFNAQTGDFRTLKLRRDPFCPICSK